MALADWANLAGLIGVAMLAYPALIVNRYAKLLANLSKLAPAPSDPTEIQMREETMDAIAKIRDGWSFDESSCLMGGTCLAGLSYALPLLPVLLHHF
jgi:hypothetical protein